MRSEARFPGVDRRAGHYESFYIKATRPGGGRAVWIRHTVHKRPGRRAHRLALVHPVRRRGAGAAGDEADRARGRALGARGRLHRGRRRGARARAAPRGDRDPRARASAGTALRRPGRARSATSPTSCSTGAPLPKTKLLSPLPRRPLLRHGRRSAASALELDGWPGMIGHNWGAEHAERWIWIQANELARRRRLLRRRPRPDQGRPADDAVGRQRDALRSTASATGSAASTGSARPRSTTQPTACEFELAGKDVKVRGRVSSEPRNFVAWVYADPVGPEHNTLNCSISDLELTVERNGRRAAAARVRRRGRLRDRHARDRPRHPAAAVPRRLSARPRSADGDDLEPLVVAARSVSKLTSSPSAAPSSAAPIGLSTESLPARQVGLERVHQGHLG